MVPHDYLDGVFSTCIHIFTLLRKLHTSSRTRVNPISHLREFLLCSIRHFTNVHGQEHSHRIKYLNHYTIVLLLSCVVDGDCTNLAGNSKQEKPLTYLFLYVDIPDCKSLFDQTAFRAHILLNVTFLARKYFNLSRRLVTVGALLYYLHITESIYPHLPPSTKQNDLKLAGQVRNCL